MTEPETFLLAPSGEVPNNPALPVLLYRRVLREPDRAGAFERAFAANGWGGGWRNGIYPFDHYHATTHEVLGIAAGEATVRLGGENGQTVRLAAGDAVVLPAGTGHRRLDASADLLVVGAYPAGRTPDLCTGRPGERERAIASIPAVPLPSHDPLFGAAGPLVRIWSRPQP